MITFGAVKFVLMIVGGAFLFMMFICFLDGCVVEPFKKWRYERKERYWLESIHNLQFSWARGPEYDMHVRFTMDFLRNSKKF